ncbi:hypothetical protein [Sphingomonas glaciei]|uniref:Tripartite tricarboxylate transporter TctB family protein n=1 Tax=Sphingomonas glaciei TaxID=2938948 RepID=A0ABY5MT82_9SPHN|nr:hypothetical protein [Sphingomonas glaciei]UUR06930.1 hypothetical protein M1K48_08145 [Sphingomonas glaciei]
MNDFEFLFALYGLMLGLSIAEVLSGLARSIEERLQSRPTLRIGWLCPLLAAFVLLDLLSFWNAAWGVRSLVRVSGESLMLVTAFASAYYLAARLVFPRDLAQLTDLDDHFFRIRWIVLGILFVLLVVQMIFYASVPAILPRLLAPASLVMTSLLAVLLVAAMIVRSRRWATVVLTALVGRYVAGYLIF